MTKEVLVIKKYGKKEEHLVANHLFEMDKLKLTNEQFTKAVVAFGNEDISAVMVEYSPNNKPKDEMMILSVDQSLSGNSKVKKKTDK